MPTPLTNGLIPYFKQREGMARHIYTVLGRLSTKTKQRQGAFVLIPLGIHCLNIAQQDAKRVNPILIVCPIGIVQ